MSREQGLQVGATFPSTYRAESNNDSKGAPPPAQRIEALWARQGDKLSTGKIAAERSLDASADSRSKCSDVLNAASGLSGRSPKQRKGGWDQMPDPFLHFWPWLNDGVGRQS